MTTAAHIPDRDYFRGSYAGRICPLYRTPDAKATNILPGLLDLLSSTYYKRKRITPEDFLAYIYGILAHPAFTLRFEKELETRELRVPITKDVSLFRKVSVVGAHLLWLHTYGERYVPENMQKGFIPPAAAKCIKAVPGTQDEYPESFRYDETTLTLHVGNGEFSPVTGEVFNYGVSGLKVVQSWLKYRMKKGSGKKSSPLDDIRPEIWTSQFTSELLELLWVLEATIEGYPEQAQLLEDVINSECFGADELPPVPPLMRKPPTIRDDEMDLFKKNNVKVG